MSFFVAHIVPMPFRTDVRARGTDGVLRENDMWLHNLCLAEQFSAHQIDLTGPPGDRVS